MGLGLHMGSLSTPLCLTLHLEISALTHKVGVGVLVCPEQGHTSANFGDTQD